jgi:hypothetical protein
VKKNANLNRPESKEITIKKILLTPPIKRKEEDIDFVIGTLKNIEFF